MEVHHRPAGDLSDASRDVLSAVVESVVRPGLARGPCLVIRTHRGDHSRPCPLGERDGEASHRPRPACDQRRQAVHGAIGEDAPMCRACGDAEAGPHLEAYSVWQGHRLFARQRDVLGGCAEGPPRLSGPYPYPLADAGGGHPCADPSIVPAPSLWGITRA